MIIQPRASLLRRPQDIGADTILEDFDFPERDAFVRLYPQGYCNVDKQVWASSEDFRRIVSTCTRCAAAVLTHR